MTSRKTTPTHLSFYPCSPLQVGGFDVVFNTAATAVTCGAPAAEAKAQAPRVAGLASSLLNMSVDLNPATDLATITLEGTYKRTQFKKSRRRWCTCLP